MKTLGWFLGLRDVTSIHEVSPSLSAPWAQESPLWVLLGVVALATLAVAFYVWLQNRGSAASRLGLGLCRGLLLSLLLITLADPVLQLRATHSPDPVLYLVLDGTESMTLADQYTTEQTRALKSAVHYKSPAAAEGKSAGDEGLDAHPTRQAFVQAMLECPHGLLEQLQTKKGYHVEPLLFDGVTTSQLHRLGKKGAEGDTIDPQAISKQLTATGQVTALGAVLDDLTQRSGTGKVAGVIVISDFANNSGTAPLGGHPGEESPLDRLKRLHIPLYTLGIGNTEATDVAVDLQVPLQLMKEQETTVTVRLRQSGLEGTLAPLKVVARRQLSSGSDALEVVGEKSVTLRGAETSVDFPYTPKESGKYVIEATVEKLPAEIVDQNNHVQRQVTVIDDYLRLLYVAYEPDFEWRFIKEVFHRDEKVGMKGFRTYLESADVDVPRNNQLFIGRETLFNRTEFFRQDILILGDMPHDRLTPRFCQMVKEFVGDFGGGLVVIAGPRFGPRELAGTEIADLLPVVVPDRNRPERSRLNDSQEFPLQLTRDALSGDYSFMKLAPTEQENLAAWKNLGNLQWYQPLERRVAHRTSAVLAEHPTAKAADGKPQPLIAVGSYGAKGGQVVYIGTNELWRLRRNQGEKYYRKFWYEVMQQLSMSHALGEEKRFAAHFDVPSEGYRVGEKATLTVEAYDAEYKRLTDDKVPGRVLIAEHEIPASHDRPARTERLEIPQRSAGVFEIRVPVEDAGEHVVRIKNPLSTSSVKAQFTATNVSAEQRDALRNLDLQQRLATETGGVSLDLQEWEQLADKINLQPIIETSVRNFPLWSTPLWFTLIVGLMLGEWFFRKMVHLT